MIHAMMNIKPVGLWAKLTLVPYSKIRLIKNKKSHAAVLISLAIEVVNNAGKAMLI